MLPALDGFAAATLDALDATTLATTARELSSLEMTVLGSASLRGVLTDTSLTGPQRAAIVRDLLRGKVNAATEALAAYAAAHAPAQDVPAEIGHVAYRAQTRVESGSVEFAPLSLLAARRRVAGFADAVLANLPVAEFGNVEDELFRFARTVEASPDLRRLLLDRDANFDARWGVANALLAGKVGAVTLSLVRFTLHGGRPRDVVGTLDALVDYVAQARNWRVARVRTARPLDESDQQALRASLGTLTGKDVELQTVTDESLLGGVLVEVGDLRLDASMRGRLSVLRDVVTAGRAGDSLLTSND